MKTYITGRAKSDNKGITGPSARPLGKSVPKAKAHRPQIANRTTDDYGSDSAKRHNVRMKNGGTRSSILGWVLHGFQSRLATLLRRQNTTYGSGLLQNDQDAAEDIDPGIADLVLIMNQSEQICTIASCQGHPRRQYPPYVYFSADSNTGAQIERLLRNWSRGPSRRLSVAWQLAGRFDENCQLRFCLYAPEFHERAATFRGAIMQFFFKSKQVQQELKLLTELMRQIVLDNGEDNENDYRS